jgi:hypothetical protein
VQAVVIRGVKQYGRDGSTDGGKLHGHNLARQHDWRDVRFR